MKKIFIFSVAILSLSLLSFSSLGDSEKKHYKATCSDGAVYYFSCECGLSAAKDIGNLICRMPVSTP
ncbi:hypothetical protein J2X31_000588 [Flavobacterium arsenatis]|uniref:Uncharacterized protein n=1 Tax=Flavobacterium arsenatis TaxID=1484332 RepID=A0ABU1TKY1_9FLAO|nr:hypothetical protein [Flavobacterium arsenatis]MDR6966590.1 hypothetical protein [Flavobacterium arsenatis]